MSDTPETDAMSMTDDPLDYIAMIEHARKMERERDEARHEIEGWSNKWECAVEMAARAGNERDEADFIKRTSEADYIKQIAQRQLCIDVAREKVHLAEKIRDQTREEFVNYLQREQNEENSISVYVSNRVQTILDEAFGSHPVDTIENNLSLLEQKIYESRSELARLTGKLGDMYEANIALGRDRDNARKDAAVLADRLSGLELRTTAELARLEQERDEARDKAVKAWEENLRLDSTNRRLEAEVARLQAGGCARDQRTTQFCAEAVNAIRERDEAIKTIDMLKQDLADLIEKGVLTDE